jgi:hypothetical protein
LCQWFDEVDGIMELTTTPPCFHPPSSKPAIKNQE